MPTEEVTRIIPDTSVIIDGKLRELIESEEFKDLEIVIPIAVLDELQAQASKGREPGFVGLEELKVVRKLCKEKKVKLRFTGDRPSLEDIKLAKAGRLDAIIRDVAKQEKGILMSADYVQALVGEAEGVKVRYAPAPTKTTGLTFEKFFTDNTISLHLKEDVVPLAKRGKPGDFKLVKAGKEKLSKEDVENIIKEITEATRISEEAFVEISRRGALVVQLGQYRIAIARPPFSDGLEVTMVRPIIKMTLEDYNLSERLMKRLRDRAEGVLIAGPPGSGKTTLASGLAEFYRDQNKIVKTLESPKDLQVGPEITQYGKLEGDFKKTADILLLVRPDYSIFDEVRQGEDFVTFADLRLAGVGMIGVVHASKAIDSIQRFIGKIELGMIPHVIDTIIFVDAGEIKKVYELQMVVKVPSGMAQADLARPLVVVKDFETGELEYEIYTFGEENIVVPVSASEESGMKKLAAAQILQAVRQYDQNAQVKISSDNSATVLVDNNVIARLIGKEGKNIAQLERILGIHLDIEPRTMSMGKEARFDMKESGNSIELRFDSALVGKNASVYVGDEFVFSAIVGKKAKIKITKKSDVGRKILKAAMNKKKVKVMV